MGYLSFLRNILWFVVQNPEDEDGISDVRWVILSNHQINNLMWSIWNPLTSKMIRLPPLIKTEVDSKECCLSSPPDDPSSIFLLTTVKKPTITFCRLDSKRKKLKLKLKWTKMSYSKQLRSIIGDGGCLECPTCYNSKVYALHTRDTYGDDYDHFVIHVDIVVGEKEVVISLFPFMKVPKPSFNPYYYFDFIKGSCTKLFYGQIKFENVSETVSEVCVFKLHVTSTNWEEIEDLNDAIFFVDLPNEGYPIFYKSQVASELGGYIHILDDNGEIIYSYHVKEKTISLSSIPPLIASSQSASWAMLECRLEGGHEDAQCTIHSKQEEEDTDNKILVTSIKDAMVEFNGTIDESGLLNLGLDVLEMIMEHCVGVEYMNFRATCNRCHLAAPLIPKRNKATLKRLQTYSLVSAWLDKNPGIITFKDPLSGDKYFIKTPQELTDFKIYSSSYGWLLMFNVGGSMVFYNPFTSDIHKLPNAPRLESCYFSSPPTSPDCMVVGFIRSPTWKIYIHFAAKGPFSDTFHLDFEGNVIDSLCYPTYYDGNLYTLCNEGELYVFKDVGKEDHFYHPVSVETPQSCSRSLVRYFQVTCDQHLLLVIVGRFGESVEVFKRNDSIYQKWEKLNGLGKYVIYICDATCLCFEAKTPEMENKIYFPRLHNGKIMFYSLETCTYHTFNGKNVKESFPDFLKATQHCYSHAWIEPSAFRS